MNTFLALLGFVALFLALVDELRSRGQSLTGWAVVLLAVGVIHWAGGFSF